MIKYAIAFTFGCLLSVAVFLTRHEPKQPTVAQWQAALSNNAVVYFRVGVTCGATVERLKPNEKPGVIHANARAYFASAGPDPYLNPAECRQSKLDRTLGSTKAKTNTVRVVTNAVVDRNIEVPPTTNQLNEQTNHTR